MPQTSQKIFFADEALVRFRENSETSKSPDRSGGADPGLPASSGTSDRRGTLNADLRASKDRKALASSENAVNVMDGTACLAMFTRDNQFSKKYWKKEFVKVDSVQTNIRAQIGCGTPVFVHFFAPLNIQKYTEHVNYDFRKFGEDEQLLSQKENRAEGERNFCLKQCYKMAYYVQKLYKYEILQMKALFSKDIHGTIWFTYAHDIYSRPCIDANTENEDDDLEIVREWKLRKGIKTEKNLTKKLIEGKRAELDE